VILQDTNLLEGLFIPQAAVQADQQGAFALAVDANNTVVRRNVELGHRMDDLVLVIKGLEEDEHVVVRGLQQVRPGLVVTTTSLASSE
jgi:membrane fusion protein (multidrug efflux system)